MFCGEIRVPGLPGEENVTDGSVDWYEMDWENVDWLLAVPEALKKWLR